LAWRDWKYADIIDGVRVILNNIQGVLHEGDSLEFQTAKVYNPFTELLSTVLLYERSDDNSNEQDSPPLTPEQFYQQS
jgi:hypothetical protein